MQDFKLSFYNINVFEEGYTDNQNYKDLYYNTLSNQFAHIPKDVDVESLTQDKQAELKEKRMIVPYSFDEPNEYKSVQEKIIKDEYPKQIQFVIAVTMRCNYNCAYCFENGHPNIDMKGEVLEDTLVYLKKEIERNSNLKTLKITWYGGEPLMNMDAIRKISKYVIELCNEKGIEYKARIITNGYYYTKEISEELKELKVYQAQIALNGLEDTYIGLCKSPKDAFKKVLQNLESSAIRVVIRLNTTRDKQDEVIELAKDLYNLPSVKESRNVINVCRIKEYTTPLKYGFTDEEWLKFRTRLDEFEQILNTHKIKFLDSFRILPCYFIQCRAALLCADGYIYRCGDMIDKEYRIGTIKDGVKQNNDVDKKFLCSTITDDCLACKMLPICCGGQCRYAELKQGKSCKLIKGRFKQNMENYLKYVYLD